LWTSQGRSEQSRRRAAAAGLTDAGSLGELIAQSDIILSVCPPHAAKEVACAVVALSFGGIYVDANAVSPATARSIARLVEDKGATFVDGGIIGLPPAQRGSTRLYLSGGEAKRVAALFDGSPLEAIVLEAPVGAASALKLAFASWTKGTAALLLAIRSLACAEGVNEALVAEWQRSMPELPRRSEETVKSHVYKAWRFVGEMGEMADAYRDAGLPEGFFLSAQEIYLRLAKYKDTTRPPSLAEVADVIRKAKA
jgi:3-hydroxyisobutyrate dehydrogenase-like beta-hydroxyacid dehydrogenase